MAGGEDGLAAVLQLGAEPGHEGCPGCRLDKAKNTKTGIPYLSFFYIWIVCLINNLPIHSLFPYLYFMIRDLKIAKKEQDIGFYAGFVGATYFLGRTFGSVPWGIFADKYGRKPCIGISILSMIVFNTLFGLSTSYWMAIVTRGLLGLLCGILVPIKAYATEVCRKEHQALGLSLVTSSEAIALVVGPAIGGFLAQPAEKYPNLLSRESIFGRFPYFLPSFVISMLAAGSCIACICLPVCHIISIIIFSLENPHFYTRSNFIKYIRFICLRLVRRIPFSQETLHFHNDVKVETIDKVEEQFSDLTLEVGKAEEYSDKSTNKVIKNWQFMSAVLFYSVFALHDTAYVETFSLWAVSSRKFRGLNLTSQDVGTVLAISGCGLLLYQLAVYPVIAKYCGTIRPLRPAVALSILLLPTYPFMANLQGLELKVLINIASLLKNVFYATINIACNILQNTAVTQEQRGVANGISVTLASMFKAVAPMTAGILFSWSQKHMTGLFLPGDHMLFLMINMVSIIGLILTFKPFFSMSNALKGS